MDDEESFHVTIAQFLKDYRVLTAVTGYHALQILAKHHVDIVLLDLNLPDVHGIDLLTDIKAEREGLEVIIVTSHAEVPLAVRAVKAGAFDFVAKSWENYQQIGTYIQRALEHRRRRRADFLSRSDESLREGLLSLERTRCSQLIEIISIARQVAATPLTVLIQGETGVGKELLARHIYQHSDRSSSPFVVINLSAVPNTLVESTLFGHEKGAFTGADRQRPGKFELADGGTLFLDEIGELELGAQVRLLRVLQERKVDRIGGSEPIPVDVRIIAATNKDLEEEVKAGRFRGDLFYRLNVVRLEMPPLRDRRVDIAPLAALLIQRAARILRRSPPALANEAVRVLQAYSWPGNVRELENVILRLVALNRSGEIRINDIPVEYCTDHLGHLAAWYAKRHAGSGNLYELATKHFERFFVGHVLERCSGNMAETARRLGVSYTTIKKKVYQNSLTGLTFDEMLDEAPGSKSD
ncbi:MAG: sigma-54 dependent transcriptional regulator [Pseudomonadota bacterium]